MAAADPRPRPSRWIRRVAWSIFAGTVVVTLGYGALVARVAMLEPSIAIDSIARLRELQGLEGGDLVATGGTWPIYIEALEVTEEGSVFSRELETVPGAPAEIVPERSFAGVAWAGDVDDLINIAKGGKRDIEPEVVEQARAWVVAYFEPRMARLRAAAREGPLGLRPVERPSGPQAVLYGGGVQRDLPHAAWVFEIPDPPHFLLRSVSEVFEIDARVAAARGDGQRAVESIKGILEIAEQLSESWDSTAPLYVLGTRSEADHLAAELLAAHPEAFGERDLARLEAALATRGLAETMEKSLARTRILLDDTLQHWYSDDGDGDGRILPHVMLSLIDVQATSPAAERFLSLVVTPVAVMRAPTRAEVAAEMEEALARIRADIALPPWRRAPDDAKAKATAASKASSIRPLAISAQEVTNRFEPAMRLARDRSLLAIAIERFRRANGRGPRALAELVPAFLPAVPVDPVTGVAYRSRVADDGAIEVWSVGRDGVDDGGVFLADARELGRIPPSPWWRALHEFRAQHGRFPADQAELASVLASEVPLPKSVEYRLEDGVPMLRAIAEPGQDVSVVRVPPAPPQERDAAPDP